MRATKFFARGKLLLVVFAAMAFAVFFVFLQGAGAQTGSTISFGKGTLAGASFSSPPTSLQFGPDGKLYVSQQDGTIHVYTVKRNGANDYAATSTETITLIKGMPNHNDDGTKNTSLGKRQVTGILVAGTAANPQIYVSSSDPRIGGGGDSVNDTNLDTNSGVISRLNWDGSKWAKTDLVRGLPRSEENHSVNGMQLSPDGKKLYLTVGGNTNKGAPSSKFALLPEYALSAAILSIDLTAIGNSTYDLPTLDPSTSVATDGPFGGASGKNQAILDPNGPVQVHAPGFRNAYDVLVTEGGKMYTVDNGGNESWGDIPENEGPSGACTNKVMDTGTTDKDSLHYVNAKGYYGGHPNPTRGNKANTFGGKSPVPSANPVECDYRANTAEGGDKGELTIFGPSTNGLAEYTASNFDGAMQGDLLAAGFVGGSFNGVIFRMKPNAAGDDLVTLPNGSDKQALFSNFGSLSLDVTAQGDNDAFPGTVWAVSYGAGLVHVFEPADYDGGTAPQCTGADDPALDEDGDGFNNADEIDNGTDPCSAASVPPDWDNDGTSNLNDPDDDNDGTPDLNDPFAIDPDNGKTTSIPVSYTWDNDAPKSGGLLSLGFTGLMTNGKDNYENLYDPNNMTAGGAAGVTTIDKVPAGDAKGATNTQKYGFQFGVNATSTTGVFTAHTRIVDPFVGMTPQGNQSMGLFIGKGDQDNYVKLVTSANGGKGGIEFAKEVGGSYSSRPQANVSMPGPDYVDLFLTVDPAAGTVQPSYTVTTNGQTGPRANLGGPESIPAGWFGGTTGLAAGIISTSAGGPEFPASWDFIKVVEGGGTTNPQSTSEAQLTISPVDTSIDASTYEKGSFKIKNNSPDGQQIKSLRLDLSTAILPDMVFDPAGDGGDKTFKCFQANSGGDTVGLVTDGSGSGDGSCKAPFSQPHEGGGYDVLEIEFNGFDPGETFTFSTDVDPTSIKGTNSPGPGKSGSISGLELTGATVTTAFDDGIHVAQPYRKPDTLHASQNIIKANPPAKPSIQVPGVTLQNTSLSSNHKAATVSKADQTVRISGPAGASVQLMVMEASLFHPLNGYDIEPYEANTAVSISEKTATVGTSGTVDIPVTLTRKEGTTAKDIGLNYIVAVIKDAKGQTSATSNLAILKLDPNYQEPGNQAPVVDPIGDQSIVEGEQLSLQVKASDPDGDALSYAAEGLPAGLSIDPQSGLISGTAGSGTAANSPYTVKVTVSDGTNSVSETFTVTVTKPGAVGEPAALVKIDPGNSISATTHSPGSFKITNNSPNGEKITSLKIDLRTAILPDMIFDPVGEGGDTTGKCMTADSGATQVGYVKPADPCTDPFSQPHDGGYDVLEIKFNGFDPGETFTFSTDVDPTSIKGSTVKGQQGSVSGVELTGTTATVGFGTAGGYQADTYRIPASDGGSQNTVKGGEIAKPTVAVPGVTLQPTTLSSEHFAATVNKAEQTVRVSGPAGAAVSLLVLEGKMQTGNLPGGGYDVEPYEANTIDKVGEYEAKIGPNGTVDIPVTLTRSLLIGGRNYMVAVIKEGGRTSPNSDVAILKLDESYQEPPGTLSAESTETSFGEIEVGKDKLQPVTLTNTGDTEVTVQSTETSGTDAGQFAAPLAQPVTVAPKESMDLSVKFAPESAGSKSAKLAVNHDGADSSLELQLSGTGVDPAPPPDTKAPNTRIVAGPSGFTKSRIARFSFRATEAAKFRCKLDKKPFASCDSPNVYKKLADGRHVFRVRATDAAGNVDRTPAVRVWRVDTAKPAVKPLSPKPGAKSRDRTPIIKAFVRDKGSNLGRNNIKLYVDGKPVKFTYNRKTDRLVYKSKKLSFGKHTVKVVATDAAKNRTVRTWEFRIIKR